jgi:hypothetical protein
MQCLDLMPMHRLSLGGYTYFEMSSNFKILSRIWCHAVTIRPAVTNLSETYARGLKSPRPTLRHTRNDPQNSSSTAVLPALLCRPSRNELLKSHLRNVRQKIRACSFVKFPEQYSRFEINSFNSSKCAIIRYPSLVTYSPSHFLFDK